MTTLPRKSMLPSDHSETLDPQDWDSVRSLGHRMLDDMFDYIATIRERPVWQPIPDVVRAQFREDLPREPTDLRALATTQGQRSGRSKRSQKSHSSLLTCAATLFSRTIGVWPIASTMLARAPFIIYLASQMISPSSSASPSIEAPPIRCFIADS